MKKTQFEIGDKVKYTAKFLKSVGGVTGWPHRGEVVGFSNEIPDWIRIKWDNNPESWLVNSTNIMLADKPDYSGM